MVDSLARKSLMRFGPGYQHRLSVGFSNQVEVDLGSRARLTSIEEYKRTVNEATWRGAMEYAGRLKKNQTKVAFFSAAPQGGVALMRYALLRFFTSLGGLIALSRYQSLSRWVSRSRR